MKAGNGDQTILADGRCHNRNVSIQWQGPKKDGQARGASRFSTVNTGFQNSADTSVHGHLTEFDDR